MKDNLIKGETYFACQGRRVGHPHPGEDAEGGRSCVTVRVEAGRGCASKVYQDDVSTVSMQPLAPWRAVVRGREGGVREAGIRLPRVVTAPSTQLRVSPRSGGFVQIGFAYPGTADPSVWKGAGCWAVVRCLLGVLIGRVRRFGDNSQ